MPSFDRPLARWPTFDQARARLQGLTAVVLDPDVEASGRIFVSLGQVGMQVRLARRFAAGLQLLEEVRPDLLLAAARLSDGDVLELSHPAGRGSRALSAPGGPLWVHRSPGERRLLAAGCRILIHKPIDLRLFAQELACHLTDRRSSAPAPASEAPAGKTVPGSRGG